MMQKARFESTCEYCGKPIFSQYKSTMKRFCSYSCSNRWKWENVRQRKEIVIVKCSNCGKDIDIQKSDARLKDNSRNFFCNHKCESEYRISQRQYQTCPICGKKYYNRKTKTCSAECGYKLISLNSFIRKHNITALSYTEYLLLLEEKEKDKEKKRNAAKVCSGREKEYMKEWNIKNREKINRRHKERLLTDELYKAKVEARKFINHSYKRRDFKKNDSTENILGCSLVFFRDYIKSKFKKGMCYANYGKWQIDHIIPLSTATTIEDVKKLCHYTNLQPLWADENRIKSNKIPN